MSEKFERNPKQMAEAVLIPQYVIFCRVFDEQIKKHGRSEKAVTETIRICRDQNVLKDYLANEEVSSIMFGYFDKEYQMELLRKAEREEGREEEKRNLSLSFYRIGISPEKIAEAAGVSVEQVEEWISSENKEPVAG